MKVSLKLFYAAFLMAVMSAVSCTKDIVQTDEPGSEKHTCRMRLVGSLVNYDDADTKSEGQQGFWADGSVIYLRMDSPAGPTTGEAVYVAAEDIWNISYYGSLYEGMSQKCTALYLENTVAYDNSLFLLDAETCQYEDRNASYMFEDGDLVVSANLKPKTGRIRFAGKAGSVLKVYGVTWYDTYDQSTDIYTTTTSPFKITVGADGYTPYFYGYFTNEELPNVKVWIDAKEAYTRFCSKDIFNPGQSGRMIVPSVDSHNGWADGLHFEINGAQFKMVAVEGGTFVMGDPESTDPYLTAHNVTLTGYCMAETEMTLLLYERIYDANVSPANPDYPYCFSSSQYGDPKWASILQALNHIEEVGFDFPTEAQWEFAAKGGVKSKGFIYSGSDVAEDVGWCSTNSGGVVHPVKQLLQNELGIYDMTGNVREHVKDYYTAYSSNSVVDPLYLTNTSYSILRGGSKSQAPITNISRYNYYNKTSDRIPSETGMRLALNWK